MTFLRHTFKNAPYSYRDFSFALGNFSYTRVFPYPDMGKIIRKYGKYLFTFIFYIACMG